MSVAKSLKTYYPPESRTIKVFQGLQRDSGECEILKVSEKENGLCAVLVKRGSCSTGDIFEVVRKHVPPRETVARGYVAGVRSIDGSPPRTIECGQKSVVLLVDIEKEQEDLQLQEGDTIHLDKRLIRVL